MKYINHSYKMISGEQINYSERCEFCRKTILDCCNYINSNINKYQGYTFEQAINLTPCLTEEEYIIKSIIE